MAWAVYVPIIASAILGLTAGRLGRGANPATMARLLVVAALSVAALSAYSMFLLGCTLIGQLGFVAAIGHWSAHAISVRDPVERSVAGAALLALVVAGLGTTRLLISRVGAFAAAYRLGRRLTPTKGLAVVRDERPLAYALPGGVFVVSASLLRALSAPERKVLLAHESAHCRHRHHYWRAVAEISAGINPLLRPVATTVHLLTERWADEEAAAIVGNRRSAAAALAHVALLTQQWTARPAFLSVTGGNVTARVAALMADPPRTSYWRIVVLILLVGVVIVTAHLAETNLDAIFDAAANHSTSAG